MTPTPSVQDELASALRIALDFFQAPDGGNPEYTETIVRAALAHYDAASKRRYTESERHAIAHAHYMVSQASPEKPDICFDYERVEALLRCLIEPPAAPKQENPTPNADMLAALRLAEEIAAWEKLPHPRPLAMEDCFGNGRILSESERALIVSALHALAESTPSKADDGGSYQ